VACGTDLAKKTIPARLPRWRDRTDRVLRGCGIQPHLLPLTRTDIAVINWICTLQFDPAANVRGKRIYSRKVIWDDLSCPRLEQTPV